MFSLKTEEMPRECWVISVKPAAHFCTCRSLPELSQDRTGRKYTSDTGWGRGQIKAMLGLLYCPLCKDRLLQKNLWTVCCFSSNLKTWAYGKPWFRKCVQYRPPGISFSGKEASWWAQDSRFFYKMISIIWLLLNVFGLICIFFLQKDVDFFHENDFYLRLLFIFF